MTEEQKVYIPEPKAPCQACVESPVHGDDQFAMVWCEHENCGGIYDVEAGLWQIFGPFADEVHFKRAMFNNLSRQMQRKPVQH